MRAPAAACWARLAAAANPARARRALGDDSAAVCFAGCLPPARGRPASLARRRGGAGVCSARQWQQSASEQRWGTGPEPGGAWGLRQRPRRARSPSSPSRPAGAVPSTAATPRPGNLSREFTFLRIPAQNGARAAKKGGATAEGLNNRSCCARMPRSGRFLRSTTSQISAATSHFSTKPSTS